MKRKPPDARAKLLDALAEKGFYNSTLVLRLLTKFEREVLAAAADRVEAELADVIEEWGCGELLRAAIEVGKK